MPKFNVKVDRTRTIEYSVEMTISASAEEEAEEKVQAKLDKAALGGKLDKAFDWETTSDEDEYEFDVSEE